MTSLTIVFSTKDKTIQCSIKQSYFESFSKFILIFRLVILKLHNVRAIPECIEIQKEINKQRKKINMLLTEIVQKYRYHKNWIKKRVALTNE